jgi:hypothetical protein
MFGQNDGQYQPGTPVQNTGQPTTDVAADGTLSAPIMADPMQSQPLVGTDASMPPYEPTPTANPQSLNRDMKAHTPEELLGIKQEALQSLKPLIGHLQQNPEERFRTTMMMIQASDDQSMISDAYEAAKTISDEKVRAQALLDVVNEINYFTAQNAQN